VIAACAASIAAEERGTGKVRAGHACCFECVQSLFDILQDQMPWLAGMKKRARIFADFQL
jgi:hypothetical protein